MKYLKTTEKSSGFLPELHHRLRDDGVGAVSHQHVLPGILYFLCHLRYRSCYIFVFHNIQFQTFEFYGCAAAFGYDLLRYYLYGRNTEKVPLMEMFGNISLTYCGRCFTV